MMHEIYLTYSILKQKLLFGFYTKSNFQVDSEFSPSITLFTCLIGQGANVEAVVFKICSSES